MKRRDALRWAVTSPEEGIARWFARTFWAATAHAGVVDEAAVEVVCGVPGEPLEAGAVDGAVGR
jgi:hypothetical protein